jgi:hypothetical protein
MKLHGQKIDGPNVEIIVLPRGNDKPDIIFRAQAILDSKEFDKLCPVPEPPGRIMKGGKKELNFNDSAYQAEMRRYADKRVAWMVLESLKATEGLEWETVTLNDHTTWLKYEDELKAAGFSYIEVQRIQNGVFTANCLNEAKVEEARQNFLHGLTDQSNE